MHTRSYSAGALYAGHKPRSRGTVKFSGSESFALLRTLLCPAETDTSGESGATPWISGAPACADRCRLHEAEPAPPRSDTSVPGRCKRVLRAAAGWLWLSVETSSARSAPDRTSRRVNHTWCTDVLVRTVFPASPASRAFASLAPIALVAVPASFSLSAAAIALVDAFCAGSIATDSEQRCTLAASSSAAAVANPLAAQHLRGAALGEVLGPLGQQRSDGQELAGKVLGRDGERLDLPKRGDEVGLDLDGVRECDRASRQQLVSLERERTQQLARLLAVLLLQLLLHQRRP
eukprot:2178910-Rhodomonas_salina.1